jgi:hypothetical protein
MPTNATPASVSTAAANQVGRRACLGCDLGEVERRFECLLID